MSTVGKIPRERLERVERLWLEGKSTRAIQAECAATYGISRRQVRNYLRRVVAKLTAQMKAADPDEVRARVEGMLLRAYELAAREVDPKAMAVAAWRIAELHGVASPQRVELTGRGGGPIATAARVVVLPPIDDPAALDDGAGVGPEPGAPDAVPPEPRG